MRLILAVLLVVSSVVAQDAKVIPLDAADTRVAKSTYEKMVQAQKGWEKFQLKVGNKYLKRDSKEEGTIVLFEGSPRFWPAGWSNGFMFSGDFKYLVPKPAPEPIKPPYYISW